MLHPSILCRLYAANGARSNKLLYNPGRCIVAHGSLLCLYQVRHLHNHTRIRAVDKPDNRILACNTVEIYKSVEDNGQQAISALGNKQYRKLGTYPRLAFATPPVHFSHGLRSQRGALQTHRQHHTHFQKIHGMADCGAAYLEPQPSEQWVARASRTVAGYGNSP